MMKEVNLEFENDPSLLADIVSALPKKMESTLNLHKNRLLGSLPKTMDDFDPRKRSVWLLERRKMT